MTWIAVDITLKVGLHGASDQCNLRFCTDYYYSNCEDIHGPAVTDARCLEHAVLYDYIRRPV
jgi:hypothetical protein